MASLLLVYCGSDEQPSAALSSYVEPVSVADVNHNEMEVAWNMRTPFREIDGAIPYVLVG